MPIERERLAQLGAFMRGRGGTKADERAHGVPCVRYGDLYTRHDTIVRQVTSFVDAGSVGRYSRLEAGDIVFAASGETHAEIGKAAVYRDRGMAVAGADTILLRPARRVDPTFLAYAVNTDAAAKFKARYGQGSSVIHISARHLQEMEVFVPPLAEQQRVADILDTLDDAVRKTEEIIAKLKQVKQGLLHDLLTRGIDDNGELRDPDRHPEQFQDSALGRIPRRWEVRPVDALCSDVVDCPHSTPEYVDSGVACVRTADMIPGEILLEQARRVTPRTYRERVRRLEPRRGDVIYSREGERFGIAAPVENEAVCLGQRVMLLRPAAETDPDFLLWAMNAPSFYRQALLCIGATTSPHVNVADVRSLTVATPPFAEQVHIGLILRRHNERTQAESREVAKLDRLKQGLMDDLLTGRVCTSGVDAL